MLLKEGEIYGNQVRFYLQCRNKTRKMHNAFNKAYLLSTSLLLTVFVLLFKGRNYSIQNDLLVSLAQKLTPDLLSNQLFSNPKRQPQYFFFIDTVHCTLSSLTKCETSWCETLQGPHIEFCLRMGKPKGMSKDGQVLL